MQTKILTIDLDERSYDIYIGSGLLYRISELIPQALEGRRFYIVTDDHVHDYALRVQETLQQDGAARVEMLVLPHGERTKSFYNLEEVASFFLENGLTRDSVVLAVGGGVIGDLTGFAASVAMRGVSYVQVPTTLLSQVDSSVGGKTGINTREGKNLVGSFYQPSAVIADIETLQTLPKRELLAGYAEIVKYGLIQDAPFFEWLEQNGARVCALDEEALSHVIDTSCRAKAAIVEADEKESGRRALLNLGHTFGHALEAAAHYDGTLLHGEAVSIGMVMAFDLSHRLGLCDFEDLERVEAHLQSVGLPTRASQVEGLETKVDDLLAVMRRDKKVLGGRMVFVVVGGIGGAYLKDDVPEDMVRAVLTDSLGGEKKEATKRWSSAFSSLS